MTRRRRGGELDLDRRHRVAGPAAAEAGVLVCRVGEPRTLPGGHLALPWRQFPDWLDERLG